MSIGYDSCRFKPRARDSCRSNLAREIHAAFKLNEQDACRFKLASEMHAAFAFFGGMHFAR